MKSLTQSLKRNGFTLPSREFQPVSGKIFRQRVFKALNSYNGQRLSFRDGNTMIESGYALACKHARQQIGQMSPGFIGTRASHDPTFQIDLATT